MASVVKLTLTLAAVSVAVQLQELRDPETFAALYHVPRDAEAPLPLLLYLHGAGESGSNVRDLISEGATGTPPVEIEHGAALPIVSKRFLVVAPQTDHGWGAREIGNFLDFLLSPRSGLPAIDSKRCYVTGHSMGGAGALLAATLANADGTRRFAASVPVAPAGSPASHHLRGMPVWAFHGKNDVVCPSSVSESLIEELRRTGSNESDLKLTLYPEAPAPKGWPMYDGHGSTIPAYATPALYRWLLERSVGGAGSG